MREWIDTLEDRMKQFALRSLKVSATLERAPGMFSVARQLAASSGSAAANHRAVRRARSPKEFIAKLQIVNEEIDESVLWLDLAAASSAKIADLPPLVKEAKELRAIIARALATAKRKY